MIRLSTIRVMAAAGAVCAFQMAAAPRAAAQSVLTISQPSSQVVYATVRAGSSASTNFGTSLETRSSTDATETRRAMLKFDTQNTLPVGTAVTQAILTVTVKAASSLPTRSVAAYQVTTSWAETQVTWMNRRSGSPWGSAGGDLGTKLATQTVSNVAGTKVSFDVTPLVQAAVAGRLGSSRYTRIALIDVGAAALGTNRTYYTPSDSNTAARPTLTVTYGGSTPPPPPVQSPTGSTLKVLEYNVHHNGIGTDGVYNLDRVASWIAKINPDLISLCEVEKGDSYEKGDGTALYKAALESKTGLKWYAIDIQDYGDWTSNGIRNAILSKYPLVATYRHEFSTGKDRGVGGVTVTVNGRTINFMSAHFDPDSSSNRITQAGELVSYAKGFAEDRIMLGDLNDQPYTTSIGKILPYYYDAWAVAVSKGVEKSAPDNPNGYTRNSRIDYVFYSRQSSHLTLKSVEVVDTRDSRGIMPSDHRPLVAVFSVQ